MVQGGGGALNFNISSTEKVQEKRDGRAKQDLLHHCVSFHKKKTTYLGAYPEETTTGGGTVRGGGVVGRSHLRSSSLSW